MVMSVFVVDAGETTTPTAEQYTTIFYFAWYHFVFPVMVMVAVTVLFVEVGAGVSFLMYYGGP